MKKSKSFGFPGRRRPRSRSSERSASHSRNRNWIPTFYPVNRNDQCFSIDEKGELLLKSRETPFIEATSHLALPTQFGNQSYLVFQYPFEKYLPADGRSRSICAKSYELKECVAAPPIDNDANKDGILDDLDDLNGDGILDHLDWFNAVPSG